MNFKCVVLFSVLCLCLLVPQYTNGAEDDSNESSDEPLTTMRAMVEEELSKSKEMKTDKDKTKESNSVEKNEEEEDDDEEGEEEEGTCDMTLNNFVRNFNATPFLPEDYEQVFEETLKVDLVNKKYNITDMMTIVKRFVDYLVKVSKNKDIADTGAYLSSVLMDRMFEAKISPECTADFANIGQAIRNSDTWGIKFFDSMGLIPTGMLRGQISSFGEYDQCIRIKSPVLENGRTIYGKHCQAQARSIVPPVQFHDAETDKHFRANEFVTGAMNWLSTKANMDKIMDDAEGARMIKEILNWLDHGVCFFHFGLCVPASCTDQEIELLVTQVVYPIIKFPLRIDYCTVHEDLQTKKLENVQWFAIICLSSAVAVISFCTLYHIYLIYKKDPETLNKVSLLTNQKESKDSNSNPKGQSVNLCLQLEPADSQSSLEPSRSLWQRFVLSFSVVENTRRLCESDKRYAPLHGLQLVLTFAIYISQCFTFPVLFTPQLLRSILDTAPYQLFDSNKFWFARNPGLWMDGFMFILGIFIVQNQFSRLRATNGSFGFFDYIWKRWSRLSVALFGALMLVYLLPLTGDGPMWFMNTNWIWPACTNPSSLMSTFLYYSNWNPSFNNYTIEDKFSICNYPTWFFSASTQLYFFAPLIFLPLYKWPRLGVSVALLILLISPLFTLWPRLLTGYPSYLEMTKFTNFTFWFRSWHQYNTSTFQYVTSLVVGLLTGYLIERKPKLQFGGKVMEVLFFGLSFAAFVLTFTWNNKFWKVNQENSEPCVLSWIVSSKFLFSGALAYISYMCCTGRGGYLSKLLSISFLQPIAKLSYGIYLLSLLTIFHRITPLRHTYELHLFQTLQNGTVDFILTSILAYIMYLLFEGPCLSLVELCENGHLFNGINKLENTDSIEELKASSSSSDSGSGHTSDSEAPIKKETPKN